MSDDKFEPVWHDCAIYCTLGNFSKHVATIIFSKLPHFRQLVKCVKIFHISSEINFGPLFKDIWQFLSGHTASFDQSYCIAILKFQVLNEVRRLEESAMRNDDELRQMALEQQQQQRHLVHCFILLLQWSPTFSTDVCMILDLTSARTSSPVSGGKALRDCIK